MRVDSISLARCIWLIPLNDLNPRGRYLVPLIAALTQRYHFASSPDSTAIVSQPPKYEFKVGLFEAKSGPIAVNLTVHGDGFVVDTRSSTAVGDEFLLDLFEWLKADHGLPDLASLTVTKLYASEMLITFPRPIRTLNDKVSAFARTLGNDYGVPRAESMDLVQLNFATDPSKGQQIFFKIERQVNTPFEAGKYFSFAQTDTDRHIQLLKAFERAAT